jgi:hypothetical protein
MKPCLISAVVAAIMQPLSAKAYHNSDPSSASDRLTTKAIGSQLSLTGLPLAHHSALLPEVSCLMPGGQFLPGLLPI